MFFLLAWRFCDLVVLCWDVSVCVCTLIGVSLSGLGGVHC